MERPTLSLVLIQCIDESLKGEAEEADHPRSPKSEHSLEGFKQATWTKRQNSEEGGRNMQAKKGNKVFITSTFNALYQLSRLH